MSESMSELEKEIEESRARLDRTIDHIQTRLSPVNLVDEMLGSARRTPVLNEAYDGALEAVRRNPLPVLLIAAGVGLLLRGMSRRMPADAAGKGLPVAIDPRPTPPGGAAPDRSYDPDQPGGRPLRKIDTGIEA